MKQVTIIIPNYRGKECLVPCLDAIFEQTKIPVDVVVVDNCSQDGSITEAMEKYPYIQCLMLDKNYGFSKAVNEGIKVAKTPYVILLNNDTQVKAGFVEYLLKRIQSNHKIFSVEAKMLNYYEKNKIDSAGTFFHAFSWAHARGKDRPAEEYETACYTFAACAGAAIYRKSIFEEIGFFDEEYFAYLEDIDIGYRAKMNGYWNVYEPKAQVYHRGSAVSGSRYNEFKVRISARNNIYLLHKNMPWIQTIINLPFLMAGFGIKILFFLNKGFVKQYIEGLKEGISYCRQNPKARFDRKKLIYYLKIQREMWMVVF